MTDLDKLTKEEIAAGYDAWLECKRCGDQVATTEDHLELIDRFGEERLCWECQADGGMADE